jgi:hypothetical protein
VADAERTPEEKSGLGRRPHEQPAQTARKKQKNSDESQPQLIYEGSTDKFLPALAWPAMIQPATLALL